MTQGKALQNSLHIDSDHYLRYFQVLVGDEDMIKNNEAMQLINELEKALLAPAREKVNRRASIM
jgi:hypothetical protein